MMMPGVKLSAIGIWHEVLDFGDERVMRTDGSFGEGIRVGADLNNEWRVDKHASSHS